MDKKYMRVTRSDFYKTRFVNRFYLPATALMQLMCIIIYQCPAQCLKMLIGPIA